MNPQHTVPTLADDDFIIWDSHAIMAYLVEKYGKDDSLYPKDLQKRAIVNQRLHFDSGILFPRLRSIFFPVLFLGKKEIPEEKVTAVLEAYGFLEAFLERSTWVAEESMTIADLGMVTLISAGTIVVPISDEKFPKLCAWFEKFKELPVYKEMNIPGHEALADAFNKRMST